MLCACTQKRKICERRGGRNLARSSPARRRLATNMPLRARTPTRAAASPVRTIKSPKRAASPKPSPKKKSSPKPKTTPITKQEAPPSSTARLQWLILFGVFLDMIGVGLVLPLMMFRWKEVGISPARLGMVGSIYSGSQLVGGLVLGKLGDRGLGRKRILLLSFLGAGVSYALVGIATSVETLALSRVLVGLTKQTMTSSAALLTSMTSKEERSSAFGRLASATSLGGMCGQAIGGYLSTRLGHRAPCFLASALFAVNFVIMQLFLPNDAPKASAPSASAPAAPKVVRQTSSFDKARAFFTTFTVAFSNKHAKQALLFRLSYSFLMRSTYSLHSLYELERWELTPASAASLGIYRTALGLTVDAVLVGILARYLSESTTLLLTISLSACNALLEGSWSSLPLQAAAQFALYASINMPVSSMTGHVTRTTLSSLFSKAVPTRDAGAALAVLDTLNSAVGVIAPLYGSFLSHHFGVGRQPLVSFVHYLVLLGLARVTLCRPGAPKEKVE